ncbi:tetratricopeptide repeat protein [Nitrosopumilus sp. K4]|uniref:tetratricopeptide repeat protein n=1 Tax=Nitrosopumilus sp. K4 TaxID=2795383 RepID=UPI00353006FC
MVGLFSRSQKDPQKKKNVEKLKELRKLVKEKKYDQALRAGTEYLQKVPENNDVLFIVGSIYYMKNKFKTAISYFEKSLAIGTYDTEVLILKANAHYKIGEKKKAIQCCDKIKEIDPKNKAVAELLEKLES